MSLALLWDTQPTSRGVRGLESSCRCKKDLPLEDTLIPLSTGVQDYCAPFEAEMVAASLCCFAPQLGRPKSLFCWALAFCVLDTCIAGYPDPSKTYYASSHEYYTLIS